MSEQEKERRITMQATTVTFAFNNILPEYLLEDLNEITEWLDFESVFHAWLKEYGLSIADSDTEDNYFYVEVYVGRKGDKPYTIAQLTAIVKKAAQKALSLLREEDDYFSHHNPKIEVL